MAPCDRIVVVQRGCEFVEPMLQLFASHLQRVEVDIKQSTLSPVARFDQLSSRKQSAVQRCSREGRLDRDLHIVECGYLNEFRNEIKDLFLITVESENETAVHRDSMGLNPLDCRPVTVTLSKFPIRLELNSIHAAGRGRFQTNQDLTATALGQKA